MLIFCSCVGLNWDNCQELEVACVANHKNNLIEKVDLNDPKAAAKQLKREKQKQKRMGEQAKKLQDVVLNKKPNENQDEISNEARISPSAPSHDLFPLVFPSASRSGPASSLSISFSAFRFGLASSLPVSPSISRSGPTLPLFFSLPASRFSSASFPSHSRSPSFISPTFTGHAFSSVVSRNSFVCQQSALRVKRCSSLPRKNDFSLPRENENDLVNPIRVSKKRLQEEFNITN